MLLMPIVALYPETQIFGRHVSQRISEGSGLQMLLRFEITLECCVLACVT